MLTTAQIEPIAVLEGHKDRVWHVAWHPIYPNIFASCGGDTKVHIWSCSQVHIASKGAPKTSDNHSSCKCDPNITEGSGDVDATVPFSPKSNGWKRISSLDTPHQHDRTIRHISWSPSGTYLACASFDSTVSIWTCEEEASGGYDKEGNRMDEIRRSDEGGPDLIRRRKDETEKMKSKDEEKSAEDAMPSRSCLDVTEERAQKEGEINGGMDWILEGVLDGHESEVKCVEWLTDTVLVTSSRDRNVWVWERVGPEEYECAGVLSGHQQDVKYCLWTPFFSYDRMQGNQRPGYHSLTSNSSVFSHVISCSYDGTVRVWREGSLREGDWECVQVLKSPSSGKTVWCAAFQSSPDVVLAENTEAERQESKTVENQGKEGHPTECTTMNAPMINMDFLSSKGSSNPFFPLLCTSSDDASLSFYRYNSQQEKYEVIARSAGFAERSLYAVDWAPRGVPVVSVASGDNSITLLTLHEDSEGVHPIVLHREANAHLTDVNTVRFSPFPLCTKGTPLTAEEHHLPLAKVKNRVHHFLLASGGDDGWIRLWRVSLEY